MPLLKYIEERFAGSQADFARHVGVMRPQVTQWINKGFVVIDGVLYSPRRSVL